MSKNRIAGITSNTVPWEILRAAGYTPEQTDAFAKVVVRRIEELRTISSATPPHPSQEQQLSLFP